MGLTAASVGHRAADGDMTIRKRDGDTVVALAGNPNVGKSTVFNALTGMHQHTGNWAGKTVTNAAGRYSFGGRGYILVDVPGTYSLLTLSPEEEAARDFICFGGADKTVVVCDAACLERNLNLVLQTLEITKNAVVCVNLMDEAEKRGRRIDIRELEKLLGVPVAATSARSGRGLEKLTELIAAPPDGRYKPFSVTYHPAVERAVDALKEPLENYCGGNLPVRWAALRLLERDMKTVSAIEAHIGCPVAEDKALSAALSGARAALLSEGFSDIELHDEIVSSIFKAAAEIANRVVTQVNDSYDSRQLKADRILTRRLTGVPVMLALLTLIFYITIKGANVPSEHLERWLTSLGELMRGGLESIGTPAYITAALIDGIYRVLSSVVAVMLPPMAIFFPLFTLLEDLGYLPRVAFSLDERFRRAGTCGKQSLTMCMGFGCNAAGIVGCRIIDSPREKLIAVLTNSFVPCNGRFPTLIAMITMFFVGTGTGSAFLSAVLLTLVIALGVLMTLLASKLLSKTVLKGEASAMTLELPPYRVPQVGRVIVRSVFDRTVFVLGRAAAVAAPAGLIIWLTANVHIGDASVLKHITDFLDPAARLIGLDGVILAAFILGLPANEIVLPIALMAYTASGTVADAGSTELLREVLVQNGWTWLTALCAMLFSLMHWPCATTILTIRKETGSLKWTIIAVLLPTAFGVTACMVLTALARIAHLA